jgi:hypothetical protein
LIRPKETQLCLDDLLAGKYFRTFDELFRAVENSLASLANAPNFLLTGGQNDKPELK